MTSLRGLDLSGNEIDLNSLAALTNLPWLGLRSSEIVDVSPLAALTNLEGLDLSHNEIADVSPLAALTKLDWLGLDGNKIVDLSPLANLTNLDRLRLKSKPDPGHQRPCRQPRPEWIRRLGVAGGQPPQ